MIRHAFFFLTFLLVTCTANAQTWATAISKNDSDGKAIIFRYVKEFKKGFARTTQPDRIIIVWRYEGEKGMPVLEERHRMDELEDSLAPVMENEFSSLVLVSTGNNFREWTYYTQSGDDFLSRLNLALRSKPVFPIEIHVASDPSWVTYDRFADSVKQ